ncbi:MAG TPA: cation transporter [Novosphingobium sp.]|nr:cation transporter [Novosphingobium sp.]
MIVEDTVPSPVGATGALRRTALVVAALNLAYFVVEIVASQRIGSVALIADSADFLEDAAVNALIVVALGWSLAARARLGFALAAIALMPALAALWTAYQKFVDGGVPHAETLGLVGVGALLVNLVCAALLARRKGDGGSLGRAAFLTARNDAFGNLLVIAAGVVTGLWWHSFWPDLIAGVALFFVNLDAAKDVLEAARGEHREAVRA